MIALLALLTALTACGANPQTSDGPTYNICGTNTGRAVSTIGDGPIYIDAVEHAPAAAVYATPRSAPITVRVSSNCAVGARVKISDPSVIQLRHNFQAKDGALEAATVFPVGIGRATLRVARRGAGPITVTFAVVTPAEWCRIAGLHCPAWTRKRPTIPQG